MTRTTTSNARKVLAATLGGAVLLFGAVIPSVADAANDRDNGHTPVAICHWVPAHGGSFVYLTVDDDGTEGNKNLQAHAGHENDGVLVKGACLPFEEDLPEQD